MKHLFLSLFLFAMSLSLSAKVVYRSTDKASCEQYIRNKLDSFSIKNCKIFTGKEYEVWKDKHCLAYLGIYHDFASDTYLVYDIAK